MSFLIAYNVENKHLLGIFDVGGAMKRALKQSGTFAEALGKHSTGGTILETGFKLAAEEFYGGEYITGDWTEDETEAYVFDRKSHAKSICKGMKLDGLSLVEKP